MQELTAHHSMGLRLSIKVNGIAEAMARS